MGNPRKAVGAAVLWCYGVEPTVRRMSNTAAPQHRNTAPDPLYSQLLAHVGAAGAGRFGGGGGGAVLLVSDPVGVRGEGGREGGLQVDLPAAEFGEDGAAVGVAAAVFEMVVRAPVGVLAD